MDSEQRPPWERLPGETKKAYEAFLKFKDLGPNRTLAECCRIVYRGNMNSINQIKRWAKTYAWRERVEVWDAHLRRLADLAAEEATKEEAADLEAERVAAARLRVETARKGVELVFEWIRTIQNPQMLPASMIPQLLKVCADLSRLEDGEATGRLEEIVSWVDLMKRAEQ